MPLFYTAKCAILTFLALIMPHLGEVFIPLADFDHQYIQENQIFYFMTALLRCDGLLSGYILNGVDYEWFRVARPNASNIFFWMSASHPPTQLSHLQCRVTPPTPTL